MSNEQAIRVLVADDHEINRDGLRLMLSRQPDVEYVGEAANGAEVIQLITTLKPEIILMDIMMPVKDGIETTRFLEAHHPEVSVIALSMFNEDNLVVDMLEAGAKGYLLKNADKKEILDAILSVFKQVPYYCRSTSAKLVKLIAQSKYNPFAKEGKVQFTPREIEIIKLICEELTNKQIGDKLFLSSRTVEGHRLKIQEKINAKSVTGIVIYAIKQGIYIPK
jgi:DNA-binding NarL/FixJ family response regulator